MALTGVLANAGSFIVSTYTYKGSNVKGIRATTTLSGTYVTTHCEAKYNNSYHYRKVRAYGKSSSYVEVKHDSVTLYRSAWWSR